MKSPRAILFLVFGTIVMVTVAALVTLVCTALWLWNRGAWYIAVFPALGIIDILFLTCLWIVGRYSKWVDSYQGILTDHPEFGIMVWFDEWKEDDDD